MNIKSIGFRLRRALVRRDMTVRAFEQAMKARKVRGTSYPQIHRYLSGKSEPGVAFVRTAAEVLDVPVAWLIGEKR